MLIDPGDAAKPEKRKVPEPGKNPKPDVPNAKGEAKPPRNPPKNPPGK
jgi:hypothetical protein